MRRKYSFKGGSKNKVKFWKHYKEVKKMLKNRRLLADDKTVAMG